MKPRQKWMLANILHEWRKTQPHNRKKNKVERRNKRLGRIRNGRR